MAGFLAALTGLLVLVVVICGAAVAAANAIDENRP